VKLLNEPQHAANTNIILMPYSFVTFHLSERSQIDRKLRHIRETGMEKKSNIAYTSSFGRGIRRDVQAPPAYKNVAVKAGGTVKGTNLTGSNRLNRRIDLILHVILKRDRRIAHMYQLERA
jgi:hypothetical protein